MGDERAGGGCEGDGGASPSDKGSHPPASILALDEVFGVLSNERRLYVCWSLIDHGAGVSVATVATKIAAWENGIPESAVTERLREPVVVSLHHVHLPKLVEGGIVEFDADTGTIRRGANAARVLQMLEGMVLRGATTRTRSATAAGVLSADGNGSRPERADGSSVADHARPVEQRFYDGDGGLGVEIVSAVASARGVASSAVRDPPLYESVDADTLEDALFGSAEDDGNEEGVSSVEFRYEEFLVRVRSDRWIELFEAAGEQS